ncbi:hypothetical protein [Mesorhizobium sp. INR15]|uniref:hypothetical protein n=1 Tax=Mesorhizobium sp. INR15 TaxID=2654248 RepID=UPI0018969BB2|nr:hypothetical protein [Mesorhizobium sp. INR15]QPC93919.1 hypothetical protein GA829_26875 [Mesorhizobium sp. INR15]
MTKIGIRLSSISDLDPFPGVLRACPSLWLQLCKRMLNQSAARRQNPQSRAGTMCRAHPIKAIALPQRKPAAGAALPWRFARIA